MSLHRGRATLLGLLAIVLWSTTFPVYTRMLNPSVGGLRAGAICFFAGGLLGVGAAAWRRRRTPRTQPLPRAYLLICGSLFVLFTLALFLAIDCSRGAQQSIEITLINYLWIPLIFVLSIPVLKQRARPMLAAGIAVATAGVFLCATSGRFSLAGLIEHVRENPWPYPLALLNAICWAAYTVFTRRLLKPDQVDAMPVFMMIAGLLLMPIAMLRPMPVPWSPGLVAAAAYASIFPGLLAYSFWDVAIRRGDLPLITAASYATPLLATLVNCLLHRTPMTTTLFAACVLVVAGAAICKLSAGAPAAAPAQPPTLTPSAT
jgi:drug/metabolite transporter (DMT)-like permease